MGSEMCIRDRGNQAYTFRAMPFGLNIAPRIFTKLGEVVVQLLRRQGVQVAAYLDDWIVWAPSVEECLKAAKVVVETLTSLGFQINYRKSRLTPASNFEWLGLQWDLGHHTQSLPSSKRKKIAKLTRRFLNQPRVSRRAQERVPTSNISGPSTLGHSASCPRVWVGLGYPTLRV